MSSLQQLLCWCIRLKPLADILVLITTPFGAAWLLWTYYRRLKLDRARWMKELYEKFYEGADLKVVRDILDCPNLVARLSRRSPSW